MKYISRMNLIFPWENVAIFERRKQLAIKLKQENIKNIDFDKFVFKYLARLFKV
jgi:hypothetical protein